MSTLWLSSPTHSHYSVVAGSLPLPLARSRTSLSLWWKGEGGKGEESPGPGGAKRPFWQVANPETLPAPSDPDRTAVLRVQGGPGCGRWGGGGACPRLWSM